MIFNTLSFKPLVGVPIFQVTIRYRCYSHHFGWCLFDPKDSIDACLPRFSSWRWVPDNGPNGFGLGTGRCGGASGMARLWVLAETMGEPPEPSSLHRVSDRVCNIVSFSGWLGVIDFKMVDSLVFCTTVSLPKMTKTVCQVKLGSIPWLPSLQDFDIFSTSLSVRIYSHKRI